MNSPYNNSYSPYGMGGMGGMGYGMGMGGMGYGMGMGMYNPMLSNMDPNSSIF